MVLRLSDSELGHVTSLIIAEAEVTINSCSSNDDADGLCSCALGTLWSRVGSLLEPLLFAPVAADAEASLVPGSASANASALFPLHGAQSLECALRLAVLGPLLQQLMLEHQHQRADDVRSGAATPAQVPGSSRSLLVRHLLWILYRHRPRVLSSLAHTAAHHCCEQQAREQPSTFERLGCPYDLRALVSSDQQPTSPPLAFTDRLNFFLWADLIPRPPSTSEPSPPYGGRFSLNVYESRYTSVHICEYAYRRGVNL